MTSESWRPVPGWEGLYSVSDHGRVRSERRTIRHIRGALYERTVGGRVMRTSPQRGYVTVGLHRGGANVTVGVHVLVLEAFVGPRGDNECARHLDDNPLNNHLSNLAWGSHKDNAADAARNHRIPQRRGELAPVRKLCNADVLAIRAASGTNREVGLRFGVHASTVSLIRSRKRWGHL